MTGWPRCTHGYNITPSHKCPWCFGGDVSAYQPVIGKSNGWLLKLNDVPCEGCGGPRGAGWGGWTRPEPPTRETDCSSSKILPDGYRGARSTWSCIAWSTRS